MGYGGFGYDNCGCGYAAPVAAPVAPCGGFGFGNGFVLIVVLFILLIIVGAAWL